MVSPEVVMLAIQAALQLPRGRHTADIATLRANAIEVGDALYPTARGEPRLREAVSACMRGLGISWPRGGSCVAGRRREQETPEEEAPVGMDSAGVYEGLTAEDLGYGDLPSVDEEEAKQR